MPCMAMGRLPRIIWLSWLALPSRLSAVPSTFRSVPAGVGTVHHLDRRAGGTGDCDTAVPVGREDLLERAVADQVARGSATVAGQSTPSAKRIATQVVPWR